MSGQKLYNKNMKTTKIDMSKVKGENVFEGAVWTKATPKEMAEIKDLKLTYERTTRKI